MSTTKPLPVLDIKPEIAETIGGELVLTTQSLVSRLAITAVTDLASCEQAVMDRQTLGAALKNVDAFFQPFTSMADKLHKALTGRRAQIKAPLERLDGIKRNAIQAFNDAQTRIRQARERELAEQRRREDQDRAAAEAAQLEHAGEHALAAAVIEEAIAAPAPVVALKNEVKAVVSFRREWKWRYSGGPKNVAETPPEVIARTMELIPRAWLCVDEARIGTYTRAMKESGMNSIPGIEIYYEDVPLR
jgi:hypothetical protein